MIVRCKRRKVPGDGGVVDGCGWQGPKPRDEKCPRCGSVMLQALHHVNLTPGEASLISDYVAHAVRNGYGVKARRNQAVRLCEEVLAPLVTGTATELRVVARKRTNK